MNHELDKLKKSISNIKKVLTKKSTPLKSEKSATPLKVKS